jgi:EpsI family protein
MISRLLFITAALLSTAAYLSHASRPEKIAPRAPFASFPMQVGRWAGRTAPDFDRGVVDVLGVDDYVNRFYESGPDFAHLYVGFYQSQHEGTTIHSPLNCLPGAGWIPIASERIVLTVAADGATRPVTVNQITIQKGLDKQVVLYWYQSHGRTVASEYWGRIYLVLDSIRLNRSDAALVRLIVPIDSTLPQAESAAKQTAVELAETMFPVLGRYLPS